MQDLNDKVTGGTLTAPEWNEVPSELQNIIENTGQTLSGADLNQLGKGVAAYVANGSRFVDSGIADAYVLSPSGLKQSPPSYADGHEFTFIPGNSNTGASTANVGGLGVVNIKLPGGTTDPSAAMIPAGIPTRLVYRTAPAVHFELRPFSLLRTFTTSGTYTPTPGARLIRVRGVGGGGGGGGVDGQGAGTAAFSGAGACGGYVEVWIFIDSAYSAAFVVGAAGVGGAAGNNNGTAGGNSTWSDGTVSLAANGGSGGVGKRATATGGVFFGDPESTGGTATGGDVNVDGAHGYPGYTGNNGVAVSGMGGRNTPFGAGGKSVRAQAAANAGNAATGYGAGGGPAAVHDVSTNAAGGNGAPGVWIVEEIF